MNLLWALLAALVFFGFAVHDAWLGAAAVAGILAVAETWSRRRRHPPVADRSGPIRGRVAGSGGWTPASPAI